jgi:hypothetical protein
MFHGVNDIFRAFQIRKLGQWPPPPGPPPSGPPPAPAV